MRQMEKICVVHNKYVGIFVFFLIYLIIFHLMSDLFIDIYGTQRNHAQHRRYLNVGPSIVPLSYKTRLTQRHLSTKVPFFNKTDSPVIFQKDLQQISISRFLPTAAIWPTNGSYRRQAEIYSWRI